MTSRDIYVYLLYTVIRAIYLNLEGEYLLGYINLHARLLRQTHQC